MVISVSRRPPAEEQDSVVVCGGGREEDAVEAGEYFAVAGGESARVLDRDLALDRGFRKITELAQHPEYRSQGKRMFRGQLDDDTADCGHQHREHQSRDRSLDCLAGTEPA